VVATAAGDILTALKKKLSRLDEAVPTRPSPTSGQIDAIPSTMCVLWKVSTVAERMFAAYAKYWATPFSESQTQER